MAYRIIVVDDDTTNLRMAGHILSKNDMMVTALKSGGALLSYIDAEGLPDLILLDINMPEMDGFETLKRLRSWERENGRYETPVIFLTADEETETETLSFEAGVSDYIKKPFNPDILLGRIINIVSRQDSLNTLRTEASTDKLTGLLNKSAAVTELSHACATEKGCLLMIDLDSFKLVNDLYGHEMGDKMLIAFSNILKDVSPAGSKCARIGGDEFSAFFKEMNEPDEVSELARTLNTRTVTEAKRLMGDDMEIPIGASVGAVFVPENGRDYETLLGLADKALYIVKQNGRHGSQVYSAEAFERGDKEIISVEKELSALSAIIGERNIPNSALRLDKQIFSSVYQYIMRYIIRNRRKACKVLFTLSRGEGADKDEYENCCGEFGDHIGHCLRKSDIFMRNKPDQYFLLLADIREDSVGTVVGNILRSWRDLHGGVLRIAYVTEFIGTGGTGHEPVRDERVVVVDGNIDELRKMGYILSSGGFYVSAMKTALSLFDYLRKTTPELILLDTALPSASCTDVMNELREMGGDTADIPVILLVPEGAAGERLVKEGLLHGACDFIRKPILDELLLQRVRNSIELSQLRSSMSIEAEKKLRGSNDLFLGIVRSLSGFIDSKDHYPAGHSLKVAEYAKEIAKRAGFSEKRQNDIYISALLHDVGKLGLPDELIGKPSSLTGEEFEQMKTHSRLGAQTLERYNGSPVIVAGAKWHHERYGGGGYPDGLRGDDIPQEARIIAIADAYAAMMSRRTYRGVLTREQARAELINGKGTQFDPFFTDIMLAVVDEDSDIR